VWGRRLAVLASGALVAAAASAPATVALATNDKVKTKIYQGTLEVTGSNQVESISLRLRSGDPSVLEVVVDGTLNDSFPITKVNAISVDARGGDDTVTIYDSNGVFTTTIPTTLNAGAGNDTLTGGGGGETLLGGDGRDTRSGRQHRAPVIRD
jgi:Ca2+-binding RTX toxin-like protein